ncbi:MAG TPA: galactokinase family protein [Propionibacteriaceae bacterium]
MSADAADLVTQAFAERLDGPPTGVWAAPGRVNLIGEHTDYRSTQAVLRFSVAPRGADRRTGSHARHTSARA